MKRRALSLLLVLCLTLGLAAPSLAAETADAIKLSRTTGTVTVNKSSDKPLTLMNNMRLYNGYHVKTGAKSYAWMNLDDTKLIKEDASGEVEVRKSGSRLEVNVCSGNVFFNVTEKLADDESLNISTSTMITGIRGTAGYIKVVDRWTVLLTVLEGEVLCSVTDPVTGQIKTESVRGGETVACVVYPQDQPGDKCDILRSEWTVDDIPGFALYDIVRDMDLCDRIYEDTGIDITLELAKEAGGDPSGRVPGRDSATPEVLGEVDRRQDVDEVAFQEKQDTVEEAVSEPENNHISPDKVFDEETPVEESATLDPILDYAPTPTTTTVSMPVTAADLQNLLDQYETVTVQAQNPGTDETLPVDGLTVAAGKTLNLDTNVNAAVAAGQALQVDGTLNGQSLTNEGTTTVTSSNSLRLTGDLTGDGDLTVTSTGHVVVDGLFNPLGPLTMEKGAQVLAGSFGVDVDLDGDAWWEIPDTMVDGSHYQLICIGPFTITFNPNGGTFGELEGVTTDGNGNVLATTNYYGTLEMDSFPPDPTYTSGGLTYLFDGWYPQQTGGDRDTMVTNDMQFTDDTTVYAHWTLDVVGDGWTYNLGSKILNITSDAAMADYADRTEQPWVDYYDEITTVNIASGVTRIGNYAFMNCYAVTRVTIPNGVTSIGDSVFAYCGNLESVTIPLSVTIIGPNSFYLCDKLTTVNYRGSEADWNNITQGSAGAGTGIPADVTFNYNYAG